MTKVTLDMNTFKALASDTRLDILKALDGKKMSLNDISRITNLNKATLHEHLAKLNEAGLVKRKEREGHKWVYYKLTWKGEGLLHPENTRIVVLFATTIMTFIVGLVALFNYVKGYIVDKIIPYTIGRMGSSYNTGSSASDLIKLYMDEKAAIYAETYREAFPYKNFDWIYGKWSETTVGGDMSQIVAENPDLVPELTNNGVDLTFGTSQTISTVAHDPVLQQAAIVCLILFGILLALGIWRYQKNKKSML